MTTNGYQLSRTGRYTPSTSPLMGLGADGEEMWVPVKCIAQVTCGSSDTPLMFVMGLGEVLMVQEVCGRQSSY